MNFIEETNERLTGKTIERADVDGEGMTITFTDGTVFDYYASDGGYSTWGFEGGDTE